MKAEYTTRIRTLGNSCAVIIPKEQLEIIKAKKGDIVKVTVQKQKE